MLSISRSLSLFYNYNAPIQIYSKLEVDLNSNNTTSNSTGIKSLPSHLLCVGKEWYRFPSHYFLPDHTRIGFIKSGFRGLLPQYFAEDMTGIPRNGNRKFGTSTIPTGMNDENIGNSDQYVILNCSCMYLFFIEDVFFFFFFFF